MLLAVYLKQPEAITVTAMAKQMGLSRQAIHNYCNGAMPTIKRALQIEDFTEGKVTLYDWTPNERPQTSDISDLF